MPDVTADGVARLWARGDYAAVARQLAPAADETLRELGDGHGRRALDLATGTGSVALALAQRGWAVSAVDLCAPLLDRARASAADDGLVVRWRVASMEDLPFEDQSFALVTSSFGLVFATSPDQALSEARRCLRPDGLLAFTAWPSTGFVAEQSAVLARYLPAGPADLDPLAWGEHEVLHQRLAAGFGDVVVRDRSLSWSYDSAEAAIKVLLTRSPIHLAAADAAGDAAGAMRADLVDHLRSYADADGRIDVTVHYLLVTARRP